MIMASLVIPHKPSLKVVNIKERTDADDGKTCDDGNGQYPKQYS